MDIKRKIRLFQVLILTAMASLAACKSEEVRIIPVAEGWANNSVNTVIFRRNSLVTHNGSQYAAFYDAEQNLVLAKRKSGSDKWTIHQTKYKGNATDAHNTISIAADEEGYLHVAWDHHNNPLRYSRSVEPESLVLGGMLQMTGMEEDKVTYPEFYQLPEGNLLFLYRSGSSGNGNLVLNSYDAVAKKWTQLQNNLIDGEGERNAYWQACTDAEGNLHVSWVWRESWDVATNHDLCYARSKDGGKSWENSRGEPYSLPITRETAELAWQIPQNSELINQTSMAADKDGHPVIATYWRDQQKEVPQFQLVYFNGTSWNASQVTSRITPFSLSGGGTKRIPVSRPQVMLRESQGQEQAFLIFRDAERGNKVSVAKNRKFPQGDWEIQDLTSEGVGSWEPSYDTELWKEKGILNLFVQKTEQEDGEGLATREPEPVKVLEWKPSF